MVTETKQAILLGRLLDLIVNQDLTKIEVIEVLDQAKELINS